MRPSWGSRRSAMSRSAMILRREVTAGVRFFGSLSSCSSTPSCRRRISSPSSWGSMWMSLALRCRACTRIRSTRLTTGEALEVERLASTSISSMPLLGVSSRGSSSCRSCTREAPGAGRGGAGLIGVALVVAGWCFSSAAAVSSRAAISAAASSSGRARRRLMGSAAAAAICCRLSRCSGPQWLGIASTRVPFRRSTGRQPSSWQRCFEKVCSQPQRSVPAARRAWLLSTASPKSSSTSSRC